MKKIISLILILVFTLVLVTGCQKKSVNKSDIFTSTYDLAGADEGRSIRISGNKDGTPGEQ